MNVYDKEYEFGIAKKEDVDDIMSFINTYWSKKNHILAINKEFFLYEYGYYDPKQINFFLAKEKKTNKLAVVQGFYLYQKDKLRGKLDMAGGLLCANPECKTPFIGVETVKRSIETVNPRSYIGVGLNYHTAYQLFSRRLKHHMGRLRHFYCLSDRELKDYRIASIQEKRIVKLVKDDEKTIVRFKEPNQMYQIFDDESFVNRIPYKDRWYVEKRYFNHPIYQYQLYGIGNDCVLVAREITVNEAKILRIVDILGSVNDIRFAGSALRQLIEENNYEYIDIYEAGVDDKALESAGFVERMENDCNIIPNYFEPFVQKNIEIYYHTINENIVIFKADGDQDRPNSSN